MISSEGHQSVIYFSVKAFVMLILCSWPPAHGQIIDIGDIRTARQSVHSELDSYTEKVVRWDAGTSYWNSTTYTGYLDDAKQIVLLKFSHGEEGYWANYEYFFRQGEIAFIAIHSGEPDGAEKLETIYFWNREIIQAYVKQKPSGEPRSLDELEERFHDEIMSRPGEFTQSFLNGVETELRNFREAMNQLPESILGLVNPGATVIAHAVADINNDAVDEYIVAAALDPRDAEWKEAHDRKLFIFVKYKDVYVAHSSNNLILMCASCGGVMGDPWGGIQTGKTWFEISHSGGSRIRWSVTYKFGYSRKYDQWQLIEVRQGQYDTMDETGSNNVSETFTPPKDYGMINFENFDPDNYLGQGIK